MSVNGNFGSEVNYEPNSHNGPVADPSTAAKTYPVTGLVARQGYEKTGDIDFEQPRALWVKVFKEENRAYLVNAMAKSMAKCKPDIKDRMVKICTRVHPDFGERLAKAIDFTPTVAKL